MVNCLREHQLLRLGDGGKDRASKYWNLNQHLFILFHPHPHKALGKRKKKLKFWKIFGFILRIVNLKKKKKL